MSENNVMEVSFPGGMKVETTYCGHRIRTDQPAKLGGEDSAPAPFDLFLASLATCAGFFVLRFCQQRDIPAEGIRVIQRHEMTEDRKELKKAVISIHTPPDFPAKYHGALARSVDQCTVKRSIAATPELLVEVSSAE